MVIFCSSKKSLTVAAAVVTSTVFPSAVSVTLISSVMVIVMPSLRKALLSASILSVSLRVNPAFLTASSTVPPTSSTSFFSLPFTTVTLAYLLIVISLVSSETFSSFAGSVSSFSLSFISAFSTASLTFVPAFTSTSVFVPLSIIVTLTVFSSEQAEKASAKQHSRNMNTDVFTSFLIFIIILLIFSVI